LKSSPPTKLKKGAKMKTAVKFLKDYKIYKAGEVIYIPSAVAPQLVKDGVIKFVNASSAMVTKTITKDM
jgi:hypothetical protein